jgi:hypothetical protein
VFGVDTSGKSNPFTDKVQSWAQPHLGYAYANDMVSGMGGTNFGAYKLLSNEQTITFAIKAFRAWTK